MNCTEQYGRGLTHGGWTSGEEKSGVLEKGLRSGQVGHDHGLNMLRA